MVEGEKAYTMKDLRAHGERICGNNGHDWNEVKDGTEMLIRMYCPNCGLALIREGVK